MAKYVGKIRRNPTEKIALYIIAIYSNKENSNVLLDKNFPFCVFNSIKFIIFSFYNRVSSSDWLNEK
jgi:hypothetical protein